jgi:hypothetical protein
MSILFPPLFFVTHTHTQTHTHTERERERKRDDGMRVALCQGGYLTSKILPQNIAPKSNVKNILP